MLVDTENLVDADSFRREPDRYLTAARAGNGPVAVLQNADVVGVLISPEDYERLFGVAVRELLATRMNAPTVGHDEVKADVRKLIQSHRRAH